MGLGISNDYKDDIGDEEEWHLHCNCIMCRSSKFGDWYLYAFHDKGYLTQQWQVQKVSVYHRRSNHQQSGLFAKTRIYDILPFFYDSTENWLAFAEFVTIIIILMHHIYSCERMYSLLLTRNTF